MSAPIEIAPYDANWPVRFARLAAPLRASLGATAVRIDHIGSTAVPGLAAKPIIDVQISVVDFEPLDAFRVPIEGAGYEFRAENQERTTRYFRERPGEPRTHIHVRRAGSWAEQFALLFRDFMREHPDVAREYASLKQRLALSFAADRHGYTDAKVPFIWQVMRRADVWSQAHGWHPGPSDA